MVGERWPAVDVRQEMLVEAIEILRELHTGDLVTRHGTHVDVESARIWDLPEGGVPIGVRHRRAQVGGPVRPLADHLSATEPA